MNNKINMSLCYLYAKQSPDNRTKVGSLICDYNNNIYGISYNDVLYENSVMNKNTIGHAEEILIFKLIKQNINFADKVLFTTHFPCLNCCKLILQVGIKHIIYDGMLKENKNKKMNMEFLLAGGVTIEIMKEDIIREIHKFNNGIKE